MRRLNSSVRTRPSGSGSASRAAAGAARPRLVLPRLDREERGAGPVQAGKILVARGLVDAGFAAELGVHRLDGQAVRLEPAVTAALAHPLLDQHPLGGLGHQAALA